MIIDDQDIFALARTMQAERGELMRYRVVGLPDETGEDLQTNRYDFAKARSQFGRYPVLDRQTGELLPKPKRLTK